jgi:hypothetical protein
MQQLHQLQSLDLSGNSLPPDALANVRKWLPQAIMRFEK